MEEEWNRMSGRIRKIIEGEQKEGAKGRKKGWFDMECREEKREVRRELSKWKRGEGDGKEFRRRKKNYAELCEKKRERRMKNG